MIVGVGLLPPEAVREGLVGAGPGGLALVEQVTRPPRCSPLSRVFD